MIGNRDAAALVGIFSPNADHTRAKSGFPSFARFCPSGTFPVQTQSSERFVDQAIGN